jgi:membrane fusion protein (multidrug efflux system)
MSSASLSGSASGSQRRAARVSESPVAPVPVVNPPAVVEPAQVRSGGSRRTRVIAIVLTLALAAGASWYALTRGHESTDDAQVDAEVVAIPAKASGTVSKLYFVENQSVKAGQLLAELDNAAATAKLAQADASVEAAATAAEAADADARVTRSSALGGKAIANASLRAAAAGANGARDQLSEAEASHRAALASLEQAQQDRDRSQRLLRNGAVAGVELEQKETAVALARAQVDASAARLLVLKSSLAQAGGRVSEASARADQSSDVDSLIALADARAKSAHAQVQTARAARDLAALELSYTRIIAPHDGVVSKKIINEGQAVSNGQTIAQLVRPGVWVTANFKETQLGRLRPGQRVSFSVDAYPSARLHGRIESFSGATGSRFALLPPDNASGNFTKVVQRVPVRVHVDAVPSGFVLLPGMSVDVDVDTRS